MKSRWFRPWWLLLLIPIGLGLARLRFEADVLDLLPRNVRAVAGVKLYQQKFTHARELIITVEAPEKELATQAAQAIAETLRAATNLVTDVTWQPPWLEHPEQTAELIAHLWFNQPPQEFSTLAARLAETNLPAVLAATRDELATTMSPTEIGRLSYDPFGFTRLPESVAGAAPGFGPGDEMFASPDGKFRILFVQAAEELADYQTCSKWLTAVKQLAHGATASKRDSRSPSAGERVGVRGQPATEVASNPGAENSPSPSPPRRGRGEQLPAREVGSQAARGTSSQQITLGFTGRPAFVAEISASMKRDIIISVNGTAVIIAVLFWLAHRRWKPMLWLLTLLALILGSTLALGGLIFGTINVVSMGFAAILLGLAVDYAVVHYQEALAHPELAVPQIRRAIAPSIFWAAVTTICAFLVLNFGGLPGLAQLGSLVGIGVALSASVMIFAFLPPLFPERMHTRSQLPLPTTQERGAGRFEERASAPRPAPASARGEGGMPRHLALGLTGISILGSVVVLLAGLPKLDASSKALQPRDSQAYAALDAMKKNLSQNRDPLWLLVAGRNEREVANRLSAVEPVLAGAVSNGTLGSFTLPAELWPRPENQTANRRTAHELAARRAAFHQAALAGGFSTNALGLTDQLLDAWTRAATSTDVFWPTNPVCLWILDKLAVREATNQYAVGFLFPSTNGVDTAALARLNEQLPTDGVWLAAWELLGSQVLAVVQHNLWKLVLPMVGLVLLSLWLAFRRPAEIFLSLGGLLLSGLVLLAVMRGCGWSWNLLNLMALPLILGTGVDYSLFMQLALRRHHGDLRIAHQSVGRALLLCGGTAIAGFGTLGLSSNAGMASLGQVCAVGIAANMLIAIYLLPVWWKQLAGDSAGEPPTKPSSLYGARLWQFGLMLARSLPTVCSTALARGGALLYWAVAAHRRRTVMHNLLPAFNGDRPAAARATRGLFSRFALKLVDLWRYEAGVDVIGQKTDWQGWENFATPHARGRGVLIVTPHLGNWELGAVFFVKHDVPLLVLTQAEPDARLTEMRQASRARRGVETLVVGEDPFAFIEIIKRLQAGATVALLVDRPPAATGVDVQLFGRTIKASIAAAELARASGCAIVPGVIVRNTNGYAATIMPEIPYDRAAIGSREARIQLTQEILRAFEPAIRQHIEQWYHFVPVWPR